MSFNILYHHAGILVVDKSSGFPSQPTQLNAPNVYSDLINKFDYVGLHHRLDTPTSGVLLLTTKRKHNAAIAAQLKNHELQRSYWTAVLDKSPEKGNWNFPIDGKKASTLFRVTRFGVDVSILEVRLETGRTHQIRRHAQMAGHPVIGDRRYGGRCGRLWPRLALHAQEIQFMHPEKNELVTVRSELPDALKDIYSM